MTTANDVLKLIKDNDVKFADFRFTDPRGKWQHVTFDIGMIEEETFSEGQMFDGSSIAGWKAIHESDMCLMPDPNSACIDPFYAETTLVLVCDVLEPTTGEPYTRDPRGIAKKAEAGSGFRHMSDSWIAFQPAIEDPSNICPSEKVSSSIIEMSKVTCCHLPRGSVKRQSTYLTSLSFINLRTSLAVVI